MFDANGTIIDQTDTTLVTNTDPHSFIRLDTDGNLRSYVTYYAGTIDFQTDFEALGTMCEYPSSCGPYGICSNNNGCSCPPSFLPLNASNPTQGCISPVLPMNCLNSNRSLETESYGFLTMENTGFDYPSNKFSTPLKVRSSEECQQDCLQNCSCVATFYYLDKGSCFHIHGGLQSVQKTSDPNQLLFIKILTNSTSGGVVPIPRNFHHSGNSVGLVAGAVSGGVAALLILITALAAIRCRLWRRRFEVREEEMYFNTLPSLPPRFSYKELQAATNDFSHKLGSGGFGSVYEGTLLDKSHVAVKRLELVGRGQDVKLKQFKAEVATVGSINHVNLVRLRGFCLEERHRLLVYEYMAKSSLDRSLFRTEHDQKCVLDWSSRYSIASGAARGLAYLHEGSSRQIIHCDIKPENILLDLNLTAKVADFGLSKVVHRDRSYLMSNMRGTRGYLAPEWLHNAPITTKSDVFSFGMVLLELCSGRKNLDLNAVDQDKLYLPTWALSLKEEGRLLELIDARLLEDYDKGQALILIEAALACIRDDPPLRPSMGMIVRILEAGGHHKEIGRV